MDTKVETTNPVLAINTFDASYIPAAVEIVNKANRKAARAGIENRLEAVWSVATLPGTVDDFGLEGPEQELATFVVLGSPLVVSGWTFVATLSWDVEAGVITRPVPDAPVVDLSQFRGLKAPICDQCGTRRQRKDVFVLRNEDGSYLKVIGRNCLAAFIGIDPAGALSYIDSAPESRDFDGFSNQPEEWRFASTQVVALASAAVATFGWVSKAAAWDSKHGSTADVVATCLYPLPTNKQAREQAIAVREAIAAKLEADGGANRAVERAEEVLAWVRDEVREEGEYLTNLKRILSANTVGGRNLGLAVSAVSAWARAQDRKLEQAERRARLANSEWVGAVKERRSFDLTLTEQPKFFDGDFGVTTLLIFTSSEGNVIKWFASGSRDWKVGTRFTGKATIKKHEEYNGSKSTVITRASLEEV